MCRRRFFRTVGWCAVGALALGGLSFAYPGGLSRLGADVFHYQRNANTLEAQQSSGRQIDTAIRTRQERVQLLEELTNGLAGGTVQLRNGAEAYLAVVNAEPVFSAHYLNSLPGANDVERIAVALLREVFSSPSFTAARQPLLAQFRTEFGVDYPLVIPALVESPLTIDLNNQP